MADLEDVVVKKATAKSRIVRKAKQRPRKALPAGRVSFAKQLDVLRAAAFASGNERKPVSNEEIAKVVDLYFGTISHCNPFFIESGLFIRNKFQNIPCEEVFAYAEGYEWDQDKAALNLNPVIRKTWFSSVLTPKLLFRPLSVDEAISILASNAGASPEYKDQLSMLIDFMRVAGIVSVENGVITLNKTVYDDESPPASAVSEQTVEETVSLPETIAPKKRYTEGSEQHPFISGLLQTLPSPGEEWSLAGRVRWLQAASNIFSLIYVAADVEENDVITIEKRKQ